MPVFTIETPTGQKLDIEAADEGAALNGAKQWHSENASAPMTTQQTVADVAKGAATGPALGAIGLAGALPDLSSTMHGAANKYLFDPIFNAISGPPKEGPKPPDINEMFGSGNIRKNVENVTGPIYTPKSEAGKLAQSATEAIPGAMLGPGGLVSKAATGIASGLGSEYLGSKYEGTPYEPWARLVGGVAGGVGAGAGSKAAEGLGNMKAAGKAGETIGNVLGTDPIKSGAVNRLASSLAEDKVTPATAAAKQTALGSQDAMLMDLGRQMQGRAEAVAQQPGKAQNIVLDAVEGRTGEFGSGARGRIEDTLNQHLGPSRNVVHVLDDVDEMVRRQATPAYEKVMADYPVVNVPGEITSRPAVAQAMKGAEALARNYGEKLSTKETKTILSGDGYHIADDVNVAAQPSLKYWDYVKKGMDQRINGMMRNGFDDLSSVDKADLGGLINAKQALVSHLDAVTGGQYEAARRIAATKPQLHEAMDFGRSIFNSKLLPEEVQAHIGGLSIPEQTMVQVGARRELERVLDSARNDGAAARRFLDTNNNAQKIEHLFGPAAAKAIENRVAAENTFQNATETIARNSRTAVRQELIKDTANPAPASYAPSVLGVARAVPLNILNYVRENGMQNTRTGIAQALTAKDQQIPPIVRALLGYNASKAANAATPLNQQTAALVRALIAGRQQSGSESP